MLNAAHEMLRSFGNNEAMPRFGGHTCSMPFALKTWPQGSSSGAPPPCSSNGCFVISQLGTGMADGLLDVHCAWWVRRQTNLPSAVLRLARVSSAHACMRNRCLLCLMCTGQLCTVKNVTWSTTWPQSKPHMRCSVC